MTLNAYLMSNSVSMPSLLLRAFDIQSPLQTRKLSYRKEDRAMRPIYGCPEKFRESWL